MILKFNRIHAINSDQNTTERPYFVTVVGNLDYETVVRVLVDLYLQEGQGYRSAITLARRDAFRNGYSPS